MPQVLRAQAVDSIPIKVPEGMKPVLKQDASGKWMLEVVSTEAAAATTPATDKQPGGKSEGSAEKKARTLDDVLDEKLKGLDWETPVPTSPAFVALGISPEAVATPQSRRELALSLLNGSDRQGKIQTGFALDFSPYAIFGPEISHNEYLDNRLLRAAYNTTISLGTTKVSEDSEAQRVALGVSVRLFDNEEDVIGQAIRTWLRHREKPDVANPFDQEATAKGDEMMASREVRLNSQLTSLFTQLRAHTWGRRTASIAWAPTWLSQSGKWNDLKYDGSSAWFGASFQLNGPTDQEIYDAVAKGDADAIARRRFFHLLAQAQFREGETVEGDDKKNYKQDTLLAAVRLRYGTVRLNGSGELGYMRVWDGPQGDGDALRYGLNVEQRVGDNTWLVISVGHDMGISGSLPDESYAVGGLRFGTRQKPKIDLRNLPAKAE